MEWQGINLNRQHKKLWNSKNRLTFFVLFIIFITACVCVVMITMAYDKIEKIYIENNNVIQQKKHQINELAQQISHLKQPTSFLDIKDIPTDKVIAMTEFIQSLPLNGGVEMIKLHNDEVLHMQLNVTLTMEEFEQLEQRLKQDNFVYKITQLYTQDKTRLDVHIMIEWGKHNVNMVK